MKMPILSLFILGTSLLFSPVSWGQWRNSCSGVFIVDELAEKWRALPGLESLPPKAFFYKEPNTQASRDFTRRQYISIDRSQALGLQSVLISDIHYSQSTAGNNYSDNIHTVLNNAQQIRSGALKVSDLPTMSVYRDNDGMIWTLDHRRLAALRLAGYDGPIIVQFVPAKIAIKQSFKKTTPNAGRSLLLRLSSSLSVEIK